MLKVKLTLVNETKGHRVYEGIEDTDAETLGDIYRQAQAEYGRCVSKVYIDRADGPPQHVGWVFEKRCTYTDVNEQYLQHAWVCPVEYTPAHSQAIEIGATP